MTSAPLYAMDTSVAVPLLVASHTAHDVVSAWATDRKLAISGHALAETYAVLTRLPGGARVSSDDTVTLIDANFDRRLTVPDRLAGQVHREFTRLGVLGGATYDGLVALAAREAGATLVTRDARARGTYDAVGVPVLVIAAER